MLETFGGFYSPRGSAPHLLEYFTFQNVFSSGTLFAGVEMLPAGHWRSLGAAGGEHSERYWDFSFRESADDVSEEFHDLEVRLGNLRATRTRLQEFLGRATGINDMLTVEKELERVALEIDHIEGRLEFLRTRAAMSINC